MDQYQISTRPRHLRYVFLVDVKFPYDDLLELMIANQQLWGGRFNPIIPVENNKISDKYIEILKCYDPDRVFYTKDIDLEKIRHLRIFNTHKYKELKNVRNDVIGVYAINLLAKYSSKTKILKPINFDKTKLPLLYFYRLNFGLYDYEGDERISPNIPRIKIDEQNIADLNKIITNEKPLFRNHLSKINLNTKTLRTKEGGSYDDFEIVIAKDKTQKTDLLYFWNRLLYNGGNTIYLTLEDLKYLLDDKLFGNILWNINPNQFSRVVSTTIVKSEIENIIETKLTPIGLGKRFRFMDISDFPYKIMDDKGIFEREYGESITTHAIISNQGIVPIPKLSFAESLSYGQQEWAIDIEIKKMNIDFDRVIDPRKGQMLFPYSTQTWFIIQKNGRINRQRNVTIFINNQRNCSDVFKINIPKFKDFVDKLIKLPLIDKDITIKGYERSNFSRVKLNGASKKLDAFLKSFNYDLRAIDEFLNNKFWVDLIEKLVKSQRKAGDSLTFYDLKAEANKFLIQIKDINKQNLKLRESLQKIMEELCNSKIFLKGFEIECNYCLSEYWYHIDEVNEIIKCKGCTESFDLPNEPNFAYKLNDIIKNNLWSIHNNEDKLKFRRDGNLTVLKTLSYLNENSMYSFEFTPQLDIYKSNSKFTDLDIVCVLDGEFIIGEAKNNSENFFKDEKKDLKALVEIAKEIQPDKIILTCIENPNNKLEEAEEVLKLLFKDFYFQPKIEALHLPLPEDYDSFGRFSFTY